MIIRDKGSFCVELPGWLIDDPYKRFLCVYDTVEPYVFDVLMRKETTFMQERTFIAKSSLGEGLDEVCLALSALNKAGVVWGEPELMTSCWSRMDREGLRSYLVAKWQRVLSEDQAVTLQAFKGLLVGIQMVSHGCVGMVNPCSNLTPNEVVDKRLVRGMVSNLMYCPVHV